MALGPLLSRLGNADVTVLMAEPNRADLAIVGEFLASGDVTPVIDRCYSLEEVPKAIAYLETGRAIGKVLITVG